jgi:hypothetical protein
MKGFHELKTFIENTSIRIGKILAILDFKLDIKEIK